MAEFIFNPAESIKQGFQQTQAGLGNIFAQVIQQQQRDYTLAESAFQNIEALKKDVNIFGQKNITAKSNELLKQAGSAILKDGKLDYSKLGEIRQGISDIKDLKAGYDVGAKEYERMLQLGIANKDNLVSFEKFYKDLSAKMADENLVKNPQDLQRAMADTYANNLDDNKMFIRSYSSANPLEKTIRDIKDPKTGALMRLEGQVPKGWSIGADGKVVPKAPITTVVNGQTVTMDYADQELARLQATDPDLLATMRKKAGFAGTNMSDKDIVKFYIDNKVVAPVSAIQVQSADQLRGQKAAADKAEFDVATQEEDFRLKKRLTEAQIARYNSMGSESSGGGGFPANSLDDLSINVNEKGKSAIFGGDGIKIDVPVKSFGKAYSGNPNQAAPFKAINIRVLPNGKKQIGGYKLDMEGKATGELYYIDFDNKDKQIQNSLNSSIMKMEKNDRAFHQTQLSVLDKVQVPSKQNKAVGRGANSSKQPVYKTVIDANFDNLKGLKMKSGKSIETLQDAYDFYTEQGVPVQ